MIVRTAQLEDLDLLAEWNRRLILDEGHTNLMNLSQLKARMRDWISDQYTALLFYRGDTPVAYALYQEQPQWVYLRQFFVLEEFRRQGVGAQAIGLFRQQIEATRKPLGVDVLVGNEGAIRFWRALEFKDYCLTLQTADPDETSNP